MQQLLSQRQRIELLSLGGVGCRAVGFSLVGENVRPSVLFSRASDPLHKSGGQVHRSAGRDTRRRPGASRRWRSSFDVQNREIRLSTPSAQVTPRKAGFWCRTPTIS